MPWTALVTLHSLRAPSSSKVSADVVVVGRSMLLYHASGHVLGLYSCVCVGPGLKPRKQAIMTLLN